MFARDSIKRRLQRVIVLTTGTVLALACAMFILLQWRSALAVEKESTLRSGRIAADASSAMLAFNSPAEAVKLLSAFRTEPSVRAAALYDRSGRLFAEYRAADADRPTPAEPRADGLTVEDKRLVLFHPVTEGNRRYGTLYLRTDLRDMYGRLWQYAWVSAAIFAGALAGANVIGRFLQRSVSLPILNLAKTAQSISQERNFGVRAGKAEGAELALLTAAFNEMLETIQRQQKELESELIERKRAQQAEAREKELLATTLASIGDAVIVTDAEGRVTFLNGEAETLTGWKNSEAARQPLAEVFRIINEQTRLPAESPVEKVLRLGAVVSLANHTLLVTRDGHEIPIDDSAAPIRHGDGVLFGVVLVFRNVAEQRQRERQLTEKARLLDLSTDAIFARDMQNRITYWSAGAVEAYGYSREEARGQTKRELLLTVFPEPLEQINEKLLRDGHWSGEVIHTHKNGSKLVDSSRWALERDAEGIPVSILETNNDITARKQAEAELARTTELLETLLASAPVGFCYFDRELRYVRINERLAAMNGVPASDHIGKPVAEIVPTLAPAVQEVTDRILATGQAMVGHEFSGETPLAPGVKRYWSESWYPVRDAIGAITGFGVIVEEITERKQAEQRSARDSDAMGRLQKLSTLFVGEGNLDDVLSEIVDAAMAITVADFGNIQLVDHTSGALRIVAQRGFPQWWVDFWNDAGQGRGSCHVGSARAERVIVEDVEQSPTFVGTDGLEMQLKVGVRACQSTPLLSRSGELLGMFSTHSRTPRRPESRELALLDLLARQAADIIARMQAEEALHEAHQQLADRAVQLDKLVQERTAKLQDMVNELQHVSYAMAHDMRAPLRAMNTFASILSEEASTGLAPAQAQEYTRRISVAANRLDKLIQDALHYTKLAQQQIPIGPVDLSQLVRDLVDTYPNLHSDKADIRIADRLPVVLGNDSLLTQCFSNLLGNAVKFVSPGVRPEIRVEAVIRDGSAKIWVKDNGIGIPKNAQARLFQMFQKLDAQYEGTGIGLAIVRKVVERMGGKVGVESEAGAGSRFWIELRLA